MRADLDDWRCSIESTRLLGALRSLLDTEAARGVRWTARQGRRARRRDILLLYGAVGRRGLHNGRGGLGHRLAVRQAAFARRPLAREELVATARGLHLGGCSGHFNRLDSLLPRLDPTTYGHSAVGDD